MTIPAAGPDRHPLRVAYLMSRFPKLSETFVLYEMLELERIGVHVEVFPLVREREASMQPGAEAFVARAHDFRLTSRPVLAAQWHWLRRRPGRYLATWGRAILGNAGSPKFLVRSLAVVPLAAAFARRIEALDMDHVHAHWATHPALAAWVIGRLTGRTYSFTAHAHDIYVERPMLAEKLRGAAFAVTISDYNLRLLAGWYGRLADRVEVIHCGVDAAVFRPRSEAAVAGVADAAGGDGRFEILSIATLQPQKGHAVLVAAAGRLVERGIPVRVRMVGEGEERPALEAAIAAAGLTEHVQLLGRQPRDRVAALLGESDVVVQPSIVLPSGKTEGIPVALMEALASAVPVVATSVSGVPELVEDGVTGRLVPPGDDLALADALADLHRDPALARRLAEAGRTRVLASFDLRTNTRHLAERFASVARIAGRPVTPLAPETETQAAPEPDQAGAPSP
jgi:colanic acid/amylovoran biosynthesis glycosyltransferase